MEGRQKEGREKEAKRMEGHEEECGWWLKCTTVSAPSSVAKSTCETVSKSKGQSVQGSNYLQPGGRKAQLALIS